MSKKYLVAVDGSDHAWKAVDMACDLAGQSKAEVIAVHVVRKESYPEDPKLAAHYHYRKDQGAEINRQAKERMRDHGVARIASIVVEGHPAKAIIEAAKAQQADMIFLGSRGLGDAMGLMLGSVSHKVLHLAPCTCVAVK